MKLSALILVDYSMFVARQLEMERSSPIVISQDHGTRRMSVSADDPGPCLLLDVETKEDMAEQNRGSNGIPAW